jgi:hypothetical protein
VARRYFLAPHDQSVHPAFGAVRREEPGLGLSGYGAAIRSMPPM